MTATRASKHRSRGGVVFGDRNDRRARIAELVGLQAEIWRGIVAIDLKDEMPESEQEMRAQEAQASQLKHLVQRLANVEAEIKSLDPTGLVSTANLSDNLNYNEIPLRLVVYILLKRNPATLAELTRRVSVSAYRTKVTDASRFRDLVEQAVNACCKVRLVKRMADRKLVAVRVGFKTAAEMLKAPYKPAAIEQFDDARYSRASVVSD